MSAEPLLAIYVPLEGRALACEFSDSWEDQWRLLVDLEHRDDLLADVEAAVEFFLSVLRYLHEEAA